MRDGRDGSRDAMTSCRQAAHPSSPIPHPYPWANCGWAVWFGGTGERMLEAKEMPMLVSLMYQDHFENLQQDLLRDVERHRLVSLARQHRPAAAAERGGVRLLPSLIRSIVRRRGARPSPCAPLEESQPCTA